MASNDFFRIFNWVEKAEDAGTRVLAFRLQAATLHEAGDHLNATIRRWPEVATFIEGLEPEAQTDAERIRGAIDPNSEHYLGAWSGPHRNLTFHYPIIHPDRAEHGQEEIKQALGQAADLEGTMTAGEHLGTVRFGFADEVAVKWLPEATPEKAEEIATLRETGLALARFAQRAIRAYVARLPDGVIQAGPPARP